jgi:hypothetical protein
MSYVKRMRHRPAADTRVTLWMAAAAVGVAAIVGCSGGSGFLRGAISGNEHQFHMELAAQRYARSVSGSSAIGSLFCFIPIDDGAYKEAMLALHAQAKLQTNEVLENIREDHSLVFYVLYCRETLIISADVYEVIPAVVPEHGYAAPERASNFPVASPRPAESFEPSDPYLPPPNPYVPPAMPAGDGGVRVSDPALCERAYPRLNVDLPSVFHTLFPYAKFLDTPPKDAFVTACREQVDDVQICLQAAFLKSDLEGCRRVFRALTPEQTRQLFGTFLREW